MSEEIIQSRRRFLTDGSKATLSTAAVVLLAGCGGAVAQARMDSDPAQDAAILNVALGLEHEAINAYQIGAESGLLQQPVLETAVLFQSHHKAHRDALVDAIRSLGGTPVEEKSISEYAKELQADTIGSQGDILMLAARLEKGAANAYLGVIPSFTDPTLAQVSGRLAADETMHWTVLASALGQQVPQQALSFGA